MKSVNIQDIAREAGVGKATVSRVINGKGYVSRETAAKVKAGRERHHYQPSALARSLFPLRTSQPCTVSATS